MQPLFARGRPLQHGQALFALLQAVANAGLHEADRCVPVRLRVDGAVVERIGLHHTQAAVRFRVPGVPLEARCLQGVADCSKISSF